RGAIARAVANARRRTAPRAIGERWLRPNPTTARSDAAPAGPDASSDAPPDTDTIGHPRGPHPDTNAGSRCHANADPGSDANADPGAHPDPRPNPHADA